MNGGDRQKTWLVMGIGNLLMGDEGLGVHVIRHLQKHHPLPNVEYVDGGTGSFHLLSYLTAYPKTVLVDATIDGKPPGTLTVLKPKFSSDYPVTLTAHDIGLKDLLDALYLSGQQPDITLFAVSIASADRPGLTLSASLQAAVPKIAREIVTYIRSHP